MPENKEIKDYIGQATADRDDLLLSQTADFLKYNAPTFAEILALIEGGDLPTASESAAGIVELATSAETDAGLAVQASDPRLSDARTPTDHAASHQEGGSDELALDAAQITSGALAAARLPVGTLRTDAAISGTLQAVKDKDGNTTPLQIGTGSVLITTDCMVNGLVVGRSGGGISNNSALGYAALQANTTGYSNTAVGNEALQANTTGIYNSALGHAALYDNTTGNRNTALGGGALQENTDGNRNSALGYAALLANTDGDYNTAVGYAAGRYTGSGTSPNQTSSQSIYLGGFARASSDGVSRENVIGYELSGSGNNTTTIGEKPVFPDMPTSDPGIVGALWRDGTTVKISI